MQAEIITIGDELLIGQVVDTNSAWMATQLNLAGIRVYQITSVSDDEKHILHALDEAKQRADIILITGGLGPTKDDITKETLCKYFKTSLVFNEDAYKALEIVFKRFGREITPRNRTQAELPASCTPIINQKGTASGMMFEESGKIFISMPGVPFEMKAMISNDVLPFLSKRFKMPFVMHKTILTQGIGESFLADKLVSFEEQLPHPFKLAYLPAAGMVRLRLSAAGEEEVIKRIMEEQTEKMEMLIAEYIYGYGEESLESIIGKLLLRENKTISTAESCSGGYIAHLITTVPGSSAYYMGSTITYSYQSKTDLLNVPMEMLTKHGAVSEEVVVLMANGALNRFKTDYSIATTGIAGPSGGTTDKPVGTVWVGIGTPRGVVTKKFQFGGDRERNIQMTAVNALSMLRKILLNVSVRQEFKA